MYGLVISIAVIVCLLLGESLAVKNRIDLKNYWNSALLILIFGLVGARLYHVVDYYRYYLSKPILIFFINHGGMGIYGGIVGGIFGLFIAGKIYKLHLGQWLDLLSVVTPLGQAIGRWANYFNQELFGLPTNLPWGIYIPPHRRPDNYSINDMYHPLFFYEFVLNTSLFYILYMTYNSNYYRLKRLSGLVTAIYFIGYGSIRFSLDFLRISPWKIYGFNVSQIISVIFIFLGIFMIYKIRDKTSPLSKG